MTTLDEMADRSDRREDKPITCLGVRTRPIDWLLTRGFLFGQEIPGSTGAQFLHSQAGDTTAVLTLRLNGNERSSHSRAKVVLLKPPSRLPQDAFSRGGWLSNPYLKFITYRRFSRAPPPRARERSPNALARGSPDTQVSPFLRDPYPAKGHPTAQGAVQRKSRFDSYESDKTHRMGSDV